MKNHNNMVVVCFPVHGLRTRNCATSVYPDGYKRPTTVTKKVLSENFNNWSIEMKEELSLFSGIGNSQLNEALKIINSTTIKSL